MGEAKKSLDSMNFDKITAVLLDVAGTTTAINFVKDTLFPYVIKNVESFLKTSWEDEDVKKAISQLETTDLDVPKAAELITSLTEKDDKNIGLKTIQGLLFKKGYESGEIKGHVFADVSKCLESWSKSKKLAVFSTGSIDSQQLLFKNAVEGDLSSYISKYFDQTIGTKTDSESYKKIASELKADPENILFLTDDTKEAEAAKSAEYAVVLVEREGNSPIAEEFVSSFAVVQSFADVPLESVKRKLEEESVEAPPVKVAKVEEKANGDAETTDKQTEETKTEESAKKHEEVMDVDAEEKSLPTETDKDKKEVVENAEEKTAPTETPKAETETVESEKMECTETEKTEKADNEIGTQTKMVTNECETQTTISIKAAEELPIETVKDKLMDAETEDKETIEAESETTADETKEKETAESKKEELPINVEHKTENGDKCVETNDAEVKSTETEECKVEEKKDEDVKSENGEVPKENGVDKVDIVEEKENKSELANGNKNDENGDAKEEEVKVKVIEGAAESAPVSVEA